MSSERKSIVESVGTRRTTVGDWTERLIVGGRVGLANPPDWLVEAYAMFRAKVIDPAYPCFFGTQAERRGEMFYAYVTDGDLGDLPAAMTRFMALAAAKPDEKNNFALFFEPDTAGPDGTLPSHDEYRRRFWRVLQHLHDHDPAPGAEALETEPDDAAWEFGFSGEQMFAVGCTPSYRQRDSRNLGPGMVILFQPRSVFIDTITKREIGAEARNQVRRRLLAWDGMAAHPDLGVYGESENREWKQYFLADDNVADTGRCPFRVRRDRVAAESLVDLVANRAKRVPDRVAVRFLADGDADERPLTYGDLDRRARALARRLLRQAEPGDRALLLLPSGLDYVVSFFACLYAGLIAVPAYPADSVNAQHFARLQAMLGDCAPRLLLTDAAHRGLLGNFAEADIPAGYRPLVVDEAQDVEDEDWRPAAVRPETIAFLQYTSGSTASPKGVMVSHANLMANEMLIRTAMAFGGDDVMVSWLPLYHDMGLIGGLLAPIFCNFPVVLMAPHHFLERPARWLKAIARHKATVSGGPDFAYQLCLDRIGAGALDGVDLSSWRLAFCGAEPIRPQTMAGFRTRFAANGLPANALYPCYGLAESTLLISGNRPGTGPVAVALAEVELARGRAVRQPAGVELMDCGMTRAGHDLAIVDPATGEVCANGRVGEIWFSGPSVAEGYWNRPEATAEIFQATLDGDPSRRYLRTGDLGFLLDDRLFVCGRLKDLIIIRGQNHYPQDIEASLSAVPTLRKGRVIAFAATAADGRESIGIAAEVSRGTFNRQGGEAIIREIRETVIARHQEPAALVLLLEPGHLPRTSSGKLRRSACASGWRDGTLVPLAHYRSDAPVTGAAYREPRTGIERELAAIWSEVFGGRRIGLDDDFLDLDGHSLIAARLAARVADRFGLAVPAGLTLTARTVAAQSEWLDRAGATASVPVPPVVHEERRPGPDSVPLSRAQEGLWFLWKLAPDSAAYNLSKALRFDGNLDVPALRAALARLVGRHDALRTRFRERDGVAVQTVTRDESYGWMERSLDGAADLQARLRAATDAPFDLENGPLLRVELIPLGTVLGAEGHALILTTHHIVSDAWSASILLRDLLAFYGAERGGRTASLPDLPLSYAEQMAWERDGIGRESLDRQLSYWRGRLGTEHPVLPLPTRSGLRAAGTAGGRVVRDVPSRTTAALQSLSRRHGVTLFSSLLAAFDILLGRYGGQRDIRVGVPFAKRDRIASEFLVGFLVNSMVIRAELTGDQPLPDFLRHIQDRVLEAQANKDLPFEDLVSALRPDRGADRAPLFQVMFNLEQADVAPLPALAGLAVSAIESDADEAPFDLALNVRQTAWGLRLSFDYAQAAFDESVVADIADQYLSVLSRLDGTAHVGELGVGAAPAVPAPARYPFAPVMARVSARAALCPDAPALTCDGATLTHGALDGWSNRIGRRLKRLGVGCESRVGLCVERSLALPAALLGALKAGGAFVPLDPTYPEERLRAMIEDAGVAVVLADPASAARLADTLAGGTVVLVSDVVCDVEDESADESAAPWSEPVHPDQLAYVIHTSGSTGRPKGVAVSHGALSLHLDDFLATYGIGAGDTMLHSSTINFDVALHELLPALIMGGRVVMRGPRLWDPAGLTGTLAREAVTFARIPTAYWQQWLRALPEALPHLRQLTVGGEGLPGDALARWRPRSGSTTSMARPRRRWRHSTARRWRPTPRR